MKQTADGETFDEPTVHAAWIGRIADHKDKDAFRACFDRFAPPIRSIMLKSGADHALCEDIVQDVMMNIWRKAHSFDAKKGSASAWIFTIARNARIDRLRRGNAQPYLDVEEIELASDNADAEQTTLTSQRAEAISLAVADLPGEQRQIIELAFQEDKPQSEIARKLGLPLGTVKSRMRLAYAKLKPALEAIR